MRNQSLAMTRPATSMDVDALLDRVGAELSSAASTVNGLQSALTPLLNDASGLHAELIRDLQSLDSIEQVLHSLSALLRDLSASYGAANAQTLDTMLDVIPLAALAQRLRGTASGQAQTLATAGDLDLF